MADRENQPPVAFYKYVDAILIELVEMEWPAYGCMEEKDREFFQREAKAMIKQMMDKK